MTKCDICNWSSSDDSKKEQEAHLSSNQHRANYLKYFYSKNKKLFLSNKKNVEISCLEVLVKGGHVRATTRPGAPCILTLAVRNNGESVVFLQCEFLHKMACRCYVFDPNSVSSGERALNIPAAMAEPYFVTVTVTPDYVGIYESPLIFQFKREVDSLPFYIGLVIDVRCKDEIVELLEGTTPYFARAPQDVRPEAAIIHKGIKPKRLTKVNFKNKLTDFEINEEVREALDSIQYWFKTAIYIQEEHREDKDLTQSARHIYEFLVQRLKPDNYKYYFNLLLNLEEIQMEVDIRKYDMKNAMMYTNKNYPGLLSLRVLGLAEKRPSLLKGDHLYARIVGEIKDQEYQGYVHAVHETDVLLGFGAELMRKYLSKMKFNIRFVVNKMPMNVMLRALTMVNQDHIERWFFPTEKHAAKCTPVISPTGDFVFYNRNIEKNHEQATAIKHIVAGSSLPAPYLLHGPPGTGKTVTVVEAILQIWKVYNHGATKAYVLVCTPSNSASDLIADRLLEHIPRNDLFRFYSLSRDLSSVSAKVKDKKCFNYDWKEQKFYIPDIKELMSFRVIVSTLCNSSRLVSLGMGVGHFTHVFLDESGHAVEPEAISPLVGLLKCRSAEQGHVDFGGQIVLAGDPRQLGPIIRCRVAEEFQLNISMLERLMEVDIYQKIGEQFDPRLLTRLKNNYRSHPAILDLPNRLFYESELKPCADVLQRESLCRWEGLPNARFPVLFHGVLGRDMQEAKNPSYFNPQEVSVIMTYVDRLLTARGGGINIQAKDIGIISPYRQQVYKIKNEVRKKNLNISVGSVDEFQGQERRVILISTVRSDPDLMCYDQKYQLGFIKNPKRFNVALTRAKSLLVVIGNPNLLSQDYHWNKFLNYCRGNGSYVGPLYDSPEDEVEDVLQRFQKLHLLPVEMEPVRISQRANQEDPEWRNDF